jgi:hypothetical protein
MNENPYLTGYPQTEVEELFNSGSIAPDIDEHTNLLVMIGSDTMYSSSITIPLRNVPVNATKVETKYDVRFTEL